MYAAVASPVTETVSESPTSLSLTEMVPVSGAMSWFELSPASSLIAAGFVAFSMVGTSLVPLMVISMSCEEVPPLPSSTVMVKVAVTTSLSGQEVEGVFGDGVIPVDGAVVGVVVCGCDGEAGLECGLLSGCQRQRCGAIGAECGDGLGGLLLWVYR